MKKNKLVFIQIGLLSMAFCVGMGAIGAHILKKSLTPQSLEIFQTGVRYQTIHSLSLIILYFFPREIKTKWSSVLFLLGIILFCHGCYLYAITSIKMFVHIVPLGGLSFIIGWLILFFNSIKKQTQTQTN
jgi:uncharacterized membrane protein YgdD (TMEM256/DUF423 family)